MEAHQLNKIIPPRIYQVIPRQRLFQLLQQADQSSAVWIAGPAGSGKTSLMASFLAADAFPTIWYQIDAGDGDLSTFFYYLAQAATPAIKQSTTPLPLLTPEYLMGVETFAIRYFETLFQRLVPPVWIVFDNFQELPTDSPVPMMVARAIELAPRGIHVAIISRHDPPPGMARLLANRMMSTIGNDRLVFSLDEYRELINVLDGKMAEADIVRLHRVTHGWIAGLILWLLRGQVETGSCEMVVDEIPASVFDYFAGEVLERTDDQTRQFLLQTALMPHMTAETAGRLTDMPAADILERLNRGNFFLEKRQLATASYQYHPLFSDFLRLHAERTFDRESLQSLCRRAAGIMAAAGFAEEAVYLYRQARDHEPMTGLILSQAPSLVAQGRTRTLTAWIDGLPGGYVDQHPWLLFWKGVGLIPSQPMEGQAFCTRAFEQFKRSEDLMGQIVSWSALVETSFYLRGTFEGLDRWITEGERLGALLPPDLDPNFTGRFTACMLVSLLVRNPGHPHFSLWQRRCEALIPQCADQQVLASLGFNLCFSYHWIGQARKLKTLVQQFEPMLDRSDISPLLRLSLRVSFFLSYLCEGRAFHSRRAIDEALAAVAESGIHLFDFTFETFGVYSGLLNGDLETARHFLKGVERRLMPHAIWDIGQYHFLAAATALMAEDWSRAEFHLDRSLELAKTCGTPFTIAYSSITRAQFFLNQGDPSRAMQDLDHAAVTMMSKHSGLIRFLLELVQADYARVQYRTTEMEAHLRAAFSNASTHGLVIPMGLIRPRLAVLCAEALRAEIDPAIVTKLINRMRLAPPASGQAGELWPWPVKLYSLGHQAIVSCGQTIDMGIKPPKKPLELLGLLIGRSQGATRETVADTLWPDTDGDRAIQNLNTTLHRLRKLLGNEKAILLENGRLSLNPSLCWVDAWHFEALTEQARSASDPPTRMDQLAGAVALYNGAFNGIQDNSPWVIGYAQRLRSLWVDAVVTLGRLYSEAGRTDQSESLLQKALTLDDTVEPVYQSLMAVLGSQGRTAEALLVFNRCRSVLARRGMQPTQDTLALVQDLKTAKTTTVHAGGQIQ